MVETYSKTEFEVAQDVGNVINRTRQLVICNYPTRDLDRLLSFYNTTMESSRDLVIDMKQEYLLKLFQNSEKWKNVYPKPDDKRIKIFAPRKSWELIDSDEEIWTHDQIPQDYDKWERDFVDNHDKVIHYKDLSAHQKHLIFNCNDFQLQNLIDVRPNAGSCYIRSLIEPFDAEMRIEEKRIVLWLVHFGLISRKSEWNQTHVSGHSDGNQIRRVIQETNSKTLVPIRTTEEKYHQKWHANTKSKAK